MTKLSPLLVALDLEEMDQVENLLQKLGEAVDFYKVGLKLFTHYGPDVIRFLKRKKKKVFLDLKFHDIPHTVAEACREAVKLEVEMITVHASGGSEMMRAAVQAVLEESASRKIPQPWVMGVTVLTSLDNLEELGVFRSPADQVLEMAELAAASNLDGVISSPLEIEALRQALPKKFKIVTPGVRPAGSSRGDQKRVLTPREAFALGADAVVVGRPILEAKDPLGVVREILEHSS